MVSPNYRLKVFSILGVILVVLASGKALGSSDNDPLERINRKTHVLNKAIDKNFISPTSMVYSKILPDSLENSVSNFSGNLGLPGKIVNNVLQLDFSAAGKNTARFLINSTVGFLGIFDPASSMGIYNSNTDFGQTLYVWGFSEGFYIELPLFGASNARDGVGRFVDLLLLDPPGYVLKEPEITYRSIAGVGALLQTRQIYGDQIDAVLYESADSYAQNKLIYLQSRRFQLKDDTNDEYFDPYLE